jgi:two-component system, chemotaxis family, chemotaxis protein CheY
LHRHGSLDKLPGHGCDSDHGRLPRHARYAGRDLVADGHRVLAATNGKEGLELWSAHSPDLVIIDIFMPVKEGLETIQELRRKRPDVKIIAISGAPTGVLVLNMAKELGAQEVLHKPFLPDEISSAVAKLLVAV